MSFHKNVFVNCPFDDDYRPLLRPLLFTITYLGFRPRIALEELDSGTPRIQKIVRLIRLSRYAIHDLSRLQAREKGEYYRLNMPLERIRQRNYRLDRAARLGLWPAAAQAAGVSSASR